MPYDARDLESLDEYRTYIAHIDSLIKETNADDIILGGDLNADHFNRSRFWLELEILMNKLNLYHCTNFFSPDHFTYLCPSSSSTSFLELKIQLKISIFYINFHFLIIFLYKLNLISIVLK